MTGRRLRREIHELVAVLADIGLLVRSNATVFVHQNPITWITWARQRGRGPRGADNVSQYRRIIRDNEFTCLLADGGILQISFGIRGRDIEKHRFVWIPSPVQLDIQDVQTRNIVDLIEDELYSASIGITEGGRDRSDLLLASAVRFDYDHASARDGHPACHLTFNRHSCRIPVFGPLSLGHFIRFVFRHFYPTQWGDTERLRNWRLRFGPRLVTRAEELEIFLDCRQ